MYEDVVLFISGGGVPRVSGSSRLEICFARTLTSAALVIDTRYGAELCR